MAFLSAARPSQLMNTAFMSGVIPVTTSMTSRSCWLARKAASGRVPTPSRKTDVDFYNTVLTGLGIDKRIGEKK